MSFVIIDIDDKHKKKLEEFLKSFPTDELEYVMGDHDKEIDEAIENLLNSKKFSEEDSIEKLKSLIELEDLIEDEWDDDDYDIEMDLIDEDGNIIDYTVTFEYLDEDAYLDYALYKEDYKLVRLLFDNGEIAEKEFMSKKYFDTILKFNEYFCDDVIIVEDIKIEKIFDIVDESIRDGVFEFIFDRVERDFDIDGDFQNLSLN